MKKSALIIAAALILSISLAGCGKKEEKSALTNSASDTTQSTTEKTDAQIQEELENFGVDASKNVDMDKVDGTELTEEKTDDALDSSAELGSYNVSIEDAKLVNGDDGDYIVVTFDFKNGSGADASFDGVIKANAFQTSGRLAPATTFETEGYEPLSVAEQVKPGKSVTVQKAYKLEDTETPVDIEVKEFHSNDGTGIKKTFNLK